MVAGNLSRADQGGTVTEPAAPVPARLAVVAFIVDVSCILLFVVLGRRSHHEPGSFVSATLKVAAPFLIALAVGWVLARAWRAPTALTSVTIIWVVTVALGMVLRHWLFDRGTAASFIVVASIVTFVFLFGWRVLYNKVLARAV
jgi:hypothetical protein